MRSFLFLLLLSGTLSIVLPAHADTPINTVDSPKKLAPPKDPKIKIEDFSWMDRSKTSKQVDKISELVQTRLGRSLHKDYSDLETLQAIIDKQLVEEDDYDSQQAMGVVLGDVMLADFPQTLEWKIYIDKLGRSRALCVKQTQQCLFPVTMLSRRMEVGNTPKVKKIYNDALDLMADYLPQMPYGGGLLHHLH